MQSRIRSCSPSQRAGLTDYYGSESEPSQWQISPLLYFLCAIQNIQFAGSQVWAQNHNILQCQSQIHQFTLYKICVETKSSSESQTKSMIILEEIISLCNSKKRYQQMSSITITFGDAAQNHRGMQIIGTQSQHGFTIDQLLKARLLFEKQGYKCILHNLRDGLEEQAEQACVLVVKSGVDCLLADRKSNKQELFEELLKLDWDSKAYMYGRVVNKNARHNLCFADEPQEPNYEEGKGRVIQWKKVELLGEVRHRLGKYIEGSNQLAAEGNYYYDSSKCGIGFHGDSERKKVIAARLSAGKCSPLHYQWFQMGKPIGKRRIIELQSGDVYIMSEKAVGSDWKKKKIATLRHATGCEKFTKI